MIGLLVKVALGLGKTVLTEKIFVSLVARFVGEALIKLVASTKTDVDDTLIEPVVKELKKHY